jgi:hypothetical protein
MDSVPERCCDIVMKGGITSGVVYPLAVVELSREFRFKNVGGTSAGAIGAALTAAAEYQRLTSGGSRAGFDVLARLPEFLGGQTDGRSNLLGLFQPRPEARRLFALGAAFVGSARAATKARRALWALVRLAPLGALLALLLMLLPFLAARPVALAPALTQLTHTAMALVVGLVAMVVLGLVKAGRVLPAHGFGLCSGLGQERPGVTDWLHATLQEAAGRGPNEAPLTFGDLWAADAAPASRAAAAARAEQDAAARAIDLQMITTALTHGRPYRLPFENRRFAFREAEMRGYFPDVVVDHMINSAPRGEGGFAGLHRLPLAHDLPVLVAARMSLSFPLLFSMVPLYAVDYTFRANRGRDPKPERCWFVDGGLSSNFPVTMFDGPLPRWPTFCIDLSTFHEQYPKSESDDCENVWMVSGNGNGTSDRWTRLPGRGLGALGGFAMAMLDTAVNWRDNTQLTVPGYRDRIAHVKLSPGEGGLNLDMDAGTMRSLAWRGHCAAVQLRERFGVAGATRKGLNWNTHRWTRFRSSMALFQKMLGQVTAAVRYRDPAYPGYGALIGRTRDADPHTGYWWASDPEEHQRLVAAFLEEAAALADAPLSFEEDAPRPRPELQITPRL